jgi:hypothetical protein
MTLILNGTDNNVSIPAIQGGTGGTSTGVYYPSANAIAISTGGVNALTISSTQAATFANNVTVTGTLTATGGIIQGANAAPAFSAYASSAQTIPDGSFAKLQFNTKTFDTASCFNTSTYRFTPTVAGYYQFNGAWYCSVSSGQIISATYKNGSIYQMAAVGASSQGVVIPVSSLISMNGSTDYVELYVLQNSGGTFNTIGNRLDLYYFQGFLARSA